MKVEHRLRLAQLDRREGAEQDGCGDEETDDAAARPAPVAAAQQPEHEGEQSTRQREETRQVEGPVLLVARLDELAQTGGNAGYADRDVDEEDPAPAHVRRECAADERPDRDRHPDRSAPEPESRAALAAVELLGDDRERDREHPGAADPLRSSGNDQPKWRRRRPTERRGHREEPDRDEEHPLAAEQVTERAGVEHHRREGQRVRVHDPLQVGERGVQLLLDVRQRDVDYGDVEEEHEHRHAHHGQHAPFPLHSGETNQAGVDYGATKGQPGWRSRGYCRVRSRGRRKIGVRRWPG
jgi:hypothetical protein